MTIIQLNPPIPLYTATKGAGLAYLVIDYGPEYDLMWVVAINNSGEIWTLNNKEVRAIENITLDRKKAKDATIFVRPITMPCV